MQEARKLAREDGRGGIRSVFVRIQRAFVQYSIAVTGYSFTIRSYLRGYSFTICSYPRGYSFSICLRSGDVREAREIGKSGGR